ncbi:MAG: arginine--tRNA ligase, partial [Candidatus Bathyarchaeia archaeon]
NRRYERNEPAATRLIRRVSELCLTGFRQTLSRLGIEFDRWDWESDLVWRGEVSQLVEMLKRSGYVDAEEGVLKLDCERIVEERALRGELGISDSHHLSPLTLSRSDGTTLYTTRDLAYTLSKFKNADRVINVVGAEQRLAQLQLKIALYVIGMDRYASNLVHFAFGLVDLPGYKMSSRRGR